MASNPGYFDNNNIARIIAVDYNFCQVPKSRYEYKVTVIEDEDTGDLVSNGDVTIGLRNLACPMNVLVHFDPNEYEDDSV